MCTYFTDGDNEIVLDFVKLGVGAGAHGGRAVDAGVLHDQLHVRPRKDDARKHECQRKRCNEQRILEIHGRVESTGVLCGRAAASSTRSGTFNACANHGTEDIACIARFASPSRANEPNICTLRRGTYP